MSCFSFEIVYHLNVVVVINDNNNNVIYSMMILVLVLFHSWVGYFW